jgi:hypothetical protein
MSGMKHETNDERYTRELKAAVSDGWIMLSEGPSGAQMELPKTMRTQTKVGLVAGFLLLFVYGVGVIVLIAAVIDYAIQKKNTRFISRT